MVQTKSKTVANHYVKMVFRRHTGGRWHPASPNQLKSIGANNNYNGNIVYKNNYKNSNKLILDDWCQRKGRDSYRMGVDCNAIIVLLHYLILIFCIIILTPHSLLRSLRVCVFINKNNKKLQFYSCILEFVSKYCSHMHKLMFVTSTYYIRWQYLI